MPFTDDIEDKFPEVVRAPEREVLELELRDADARVVRSLTVRLGLPADRVVHLALALLARGGRGATGNMVPWPQHDGSAMRQGPAPRVLDLTGRPPPFADD